MYIFGLTQEAVFTIIVFWLKSKNIDFVKTVQYLPRSHNSNLTDKHITLHQKHKEATKAESKYLNKTITVSGSVSELNKKELTIDDKVFCLFNESITNIFLLKNPF